jgi:hypothetical protein
MITTKGTIKYLFLPQNRGEGNKNLKAIRFQPDREKVNECYIKPVN